MRGIKNGADILSLDISASCTGWSAINHEDGVFIYGNITTKAKLPTAARLDKFRDELKFLLSKYKPRVVVIEDTFLGRNPLVNKLLSKFAGVAEQTIFEYRKAPPYIVSNKTVKAFFKAKDKEALFNIMLDLLEWDPGFYPFKKYNDVVDSIAQLIYCCDSILKTKKHRTEHEYGFKYKI
jgi:Holliday junction resolvasome RuvABC endonuclease subunit